MNCSNNIANTRPEIAMEWDYEENRGLRPEDFTIGAKKKVSWICKKGHKYVARIDSRTKDNGTGCPYCSGLKPIKGTNDLLTLRPEIAMEWDYDRNINLKPEDFTVSSGKKVSWICNKGHSFVASIHSRTMKKGTGCPYCSGLKPIKGTNDLLTLRPEISVKWDYEENINLKPEDFKVSSGKKVSWICDKGHKYVARISSRTKDNGTGCPYCSGRKPIKGENDLKKLRPEIAAEWDYENNGDLKPEDFSVGSKKKVSWVCKKGHSFVAVISDRTKNKGTGCPYCSGLKPIKGTNDLLTLRPEIAKEWDYERNNNLKPEDFTVSSSKKVSWICNKRHSFVAIIGNRTKENGSGCPYCAGLKPIKGTNDLLTLRPEIAEEWDYEGNGNLRPEDFMVSSNQKVIWICKKGHKYNARIGHRTGKVESGCPYCAGRKPIKGVNDLLTLRPEIAMEWDYVRNRNLKPTDVGIGSHKKVWWKCEICNFNWKSKICSRARGESLCKNCLKQ